MVTGTCTSPADWYRCLSPCTIKAAYFWGTDEMEDVFILDKRLGIAVPVLDGEWEEYPQEERQEILYTWEKIRGGSRTGYQSLRRR